MCTRMRALVDEHPGYYCTDFRTKETSLLLSGHAPEQLQSLHELDVWAAGMNSMMLLPPEACMMRQGCSL